MRKCTSFPSLVVLKHIHMSCMFPFLLLPLLSLPFCVCLSLSPPPLSSSSYFPFMKNGLGVQMDDLTHRSGVFPLLSCFWLSRLTMWQTQFGVMPSTPGQSSRKQKKPKPLHIAQTGTHTQIWGGLLSCVGLFFFLFFLQSASLSFSLALPFSLLEKTDLF